MSGSGLCWECREELKERGYNVEDLAEFYRCSHDSPEEPYPSASIPEK